MDPYDQVPYASRPLPEAHPDRLFVVAHLFGLDPVPPDRARILEVGCGAGEHLAPIAARHPDALCVGLERAATAVEAARATGTPARWVQADLLDASEALQGLSEGWDYVVAHGVYSWVPGEVAEALLRLVGRALAPSGVGYVSYNTYPGWHLRGMMAQMLQFHAAPFGGPGAAVPQARALLDFLADVVPESDPYGGWLRREARLVRQQPDAWVFHDLLAEHNHPKLLTEVVAAARAVGLAYLGDADLPSMLPERLPAEVRRVLDRLGSDVVSLEQYTDFVVCRNFRRTLLVPEAAPIDRVLRPERLEDLAIRGLLVPSGPAAADGTQPFETRDGDSLQTSSPLLRAALHVLFDRAPDAVAFDELLAEAAAASGEPGDRDLLARNLLVCFSRGLVQLYPRPLGAAAGVAARPQADAWVRAQAERGGAFVTSLLHEHVTIDAFDRAVLPALDGTRGLDELVVAVRDALIRGEAVLRRDGAPVTDPEHVAGWVRSTLPGRLGAYARAGLLTRR